MRKVKAIKQLCCFDNKAPTGQPFPVANVGAPSSI